VLIFTFQTIRILTSPLDI